MNNLSIKVCVISAGRHGNVPAVQSQFKMCTWYVPTTQVTFYVIAGATDVVGVNGVLPMKALQLNQALAEGFVSHDIVATVDDDIIRCVNVGIRKSIPLDDVVQDIGHKLANYTTGVKLGGPYSGGNTSWAGGIVKRTGRVPGAMMLHKPNDLLFDNAVVGMEDLDYCINQHITYGGVLLDGSWCLENQWRDNEGGFQDWRTPESILKCVETLSAKWGEYGCKFAVDKSHKNGMTFRVPWARLGGKQKHPRG